MKKSRHLKKLLFILSRTIATFLLAVLRDIVNRQPMACAYELIRQEKKNLHVYIHSGGQALDILNHPTTRFFLDIVIPVLL